MPTGKQIRAARVLLDWNVEDLSTHAGVNRESILHAERGERRTRVDTMDKIARALSTAGVEFLENNGVRQRPEGIEVMNGREGLCALLDDVYSHASHSGGEISITGFDLDQWTSILGDYVDVQVERMTELFKKRQDIRVRTIVREGTAELIGNEYSQYRWQDREDFDGVPFYVYGDYLAIISFQGDPSPKIIKLRSPPIAAAYQLQFNSMWRLAKEVPASKKK